jgi:predicted amidohydrolase
LPLPDTIPGPATKTIAEVAQKNNVSVVVPIFEKRSSGVYHNSLVVIDSDGKILGTYRKMHIPDDPGFYEKNFTFHLVISVIKILILLSEKSVHLFVGISGIRKRQD